MNAAVRRPGAGRGFTLVELLTVVAIIAILMALVAGAFTAVRGSYQRAATIEVFRAIEAGLQNYYNDWGMYPYRAPVEIADPSKPSRKIQIMDTVAVSLNPVAGAGDIELPALLYAALNARIRSGPYMGGSTPLTKEVKTTSSGRTYTCMVFVDGWDRPILYGPPVSGSGITMPRLESKGVNEADKEDNVKNYNYTDSLEK
jgi:prepilin-type N-terminal cleavage/methylation domain-containing protein